MDEITKVRNTLLLRVEEAEDKSSILRAPELKSLYSQIPSLSVAERAEFGRKINDLKSELEQIVGSYAQKEMQKSKIDVTAPFDENTDHNLRPKLLSSDLGSIHPLSLELDEILRIFQKMGFEVIVSRQLDDDYHMFESLNFPKDHPARDDYDTFITDEGLIPPAQTSTMQNRVLRSGKHLLEKGEAMGVVIPGRTFRNEDTDARHEHTFHQIEGLYVGKNITVGNLLATFKEFLSAYFKKEVDVRVNPFYFPFVEPGFEFSLTCPFCEKRGCRVCSYEGWIELMGCGLVHPKVLEMAEIDSQKYTGFAWGFGLERLVMMRYNIEDIRHFFSGNLDFLKQFRGQL